MLVRQGLDVSANPAFTAEAASPREAVRLLQRDLSAAGARILAGDVSGAEARPTSSLAGYRQVTDAWLVALATSHEGLLATLDRGVAAVVPAKGVRNVEFIG